jgi:hypothetical protein
VHLQAQKRHQEATQARIDAARAEAERAAGERSRAQRRDGTNHRNASSVGREFTCACALRILHRRQFQCTPANVRAAAHLPTRPPLPPGLPRRPATAEQQERPPPQLAHTPSGAVVEIDDWLIDFANLFRDVSGLDADRHIDYHNEGCGGAAFSRLFFWEGVGRDLNFA